MRSMLPSKFLDRSERQVGEKLELAVQYHDGTIHLHDRMYRMRNGSMERIFSIEHGR